jgi:hypothetical protein
MDDKPQIIAKINHPAASGRGIEKTSIKIGKREPLKETVGNSL